MIKLLKILDIFKFFSPYIIGRNKLNEVKLIFNFLTIFLSLYFSSLFFSLFSFLGTFWVLNKAKAPFGTRKIVGKENREEKWKEIVSVGDLNS